MVRLRSLLVALLVVSACSREAPPPRDVGAPPVVPPAPGRGNASVEAKLDLLLIRQEDLDRKLDKVLTRLDEIEKKGAVAGARKRMDPDTVYAVDPAGGALYGPKVAKVTLVEGFEMACPYCKMLAPVLNDVVAKRSDVRLVKLHFVVHPDKATIPAHAYCAAERQGRHAELETLINEYGFPNDLGEDAMLRFASRLGLDEPRFRRDMASEGCKKLALEQYDHLRKLGVTGTPSLFINGKPYLGARTVEALDEAIDKAAAEVDAVVGKKGVTVENYYQREVVEKGKKTGP